MNETDSLLTLNIKLELCWHKSTFIFPLRENFVKDGEKSERLVSSCSQIWCAMKISGLARYVSECDLWLYLMLKIKNCFSSVVPFVSFNLNRILSVQILVICDDFQLIRCQNYLFWQHSIVLDKKFFNVSSY